MKKEVEERSDLKDDHEGNTADPRLPCLVNTNSIDNDNKAINSSHNNLDVDVQEAGNMKHWQGRIGIDQCTQSRGVC